MAVRTANKPGACTSSGNASNDVGASLSCGRRVGPALPDANDTAVKSANKTIGPIAASRHLPGLAAQGETGTDSAHLAVNPQRPAAIGPAPPPEKPKKKRKRFWDEGVVNEETSKRPSILNLVGPSVGTSVGGSLNLTGTWTVKVRNPSSQFVYDLTQRSDGAVTGQGALVGRGVKLGSSSKVTGQLQGHVFTWTEETGGRFRATVANDAQSFSGTTTLMDAPRTSEAIVYFEAVRNVSEGSCNEQASTPDALVTFRDGTEAEAVQCTMRTLKNVFPGLARLVGAVQQNDQSFDLDIQDLLSECPLGDDARRALLPLLKALIVDRINDVVVPSSAVASLAIADWLGCGETSMQALANAVKSRATEVPAMLAACEGPSVAHVLRRGIIIMDVAVIEALARDASCNKWQTLCGRTVLHFLARLASQDSNALRLSRAAIAALKLGLKAREIHAVIPDCLRLNTSGTSLTLSLRKRGIGPEGAARLELPCADITEIDMDLTRCGIRAVGAASLKFPVGLQKLRLVLQKCDIGPEGAKGLTLPSSLSRLELDLSHCLIGPAGAAALRLPTTLVELDLSLLRCAIGDKGAKALALPEGIQHLKLDLARCEVGTDGIKSLRFPPRLKSLSLDLTMCQVSTDGLRCLIAGLQPSLELLTLQLAGCGLSAEFLHSMEVGLGKKFPKLREHNFLSD